MKRKAILPLMLMCIFLSAFVACTCNDDDDDPSTSSGQADDDTQVPDDDADDDVNDDADDDAQDVTKRDLTLTLEYRNKLQMHLEERGDSLEAVFQTYAGYGDDLLAQGQVLAATGEIIRFPEAKYEIYTLSFTGPAVTSGPCGAHSISYRMTLTGQTDASERLGGIAAYCGHDTGGRPERILRIIGKFE